MRLQKIILSEETVNSVILFLKYFEMEQFWKKA